MRKLIPLILLVFLLALLPATAQDDADEAPHPLLEMLGFVPVELLTEVSFFDLSYVDYRAFEAGSGLFRPATTDLNLPVASMWVSKSWRLAASPQFMQYVLHDLDAMRDVVGFIVFDIDRVLMFGAPPANGIVLAGDPDALTDPLIHREKFTERGFKFENIDDFTLWQDPERDGLQVDIENRNMANPFGGHLGRAEPVAMRPGYLINSAGIELVQMMIAADTGQATSLADVPEFVALVEAITQDGPLIQAHFLSPADVGIIPGDPTMLFTEQDAPNVLADYGPLPVYNMSVLADTQDDDGTIHIAALVYADAADAAIAADEIAQRLSTLRLPLDADETVLEMFGATVESAVYESADGLAVAVARVRYDPPANRLDTPGLMYSRLIRSLWMREFFVFMITE